MQFLTYISFIGIHVILNHNFLSELTYEFASHVNTHASKIMRTCDLVGHGL